MCLCLVAVIGGWVHVFVFSYSDRRLGTCVCVYLQKRGGGQVIYYPSPNLRVVKAQSLAG